MTNYILLKKYVCTTYPIFTCKFKDNEETLLHALKFCQISMSMNYILAGIFIDEAKVYVLNNTNEKGKYFPNGI